MSAPKLRDVLHRAGAQVQRLALRADQAGVEQRQGVAADLHPVAAALEAGDDVARIDGLRLAGGMMRDQTRSRLSVESALSVPLCGMPFGKMSDIGTSSAIEKTLKPVNTSSIGVRRAPGMPPRSLGPG